MIVTTANSFGQPVEGMKVVVLSTQEKVLVITEDPQGRYLPNFKEKTLASAAAAERSTAASHTTVTLVLEVALEGKGIYEFARDLPTVIEYHWAYHDECWRVDQLASGFTLVGGFFVGGGLVTAIASEIAEPIVEGLLTTTWCFFHWDHPARIRVYHSIPGITLPWMQIIGPCPDDPPIDICTVIPQVQVSGSVIDARTGDGVYNASVQVYNGRGTTTDHDGYYTIIGVPVGYQQIEVSKTGYISDAKIINVSPGGGYANFSLTPEGLSNDEYRFKLSWGANPRDLDSHLWLPESNPAHIYFSSRGTLTAFPYAILDLDDTDGNGPETITMFRTYSGTYLYAVHRYAGTGTLAGSGATVEITRGSHRVLQLTAPTTGTGDWWVVATVTSPGNLVIQHNYITTTAPRAYAAETELLPPKEIIP